MYKGISTALENQTRFYLVNNFKLLDFQLSAFLYH